MAVSKKEMRKNLYGYRMPDGRLICTMADAAIVNIAAADGHPVEIMDMSFAMQAIAAEYILKNHKNLENKVYNIPEEQDRYVAELKLKAFGGSFDTLSDKQKAYLAGH